MRIFTPGGELPFAGHPVLGTSFVVGEALGVDAVMLETNAGPVPLELERTAGVIVVRPHVSSRCRTWEPFDTRRRAAAALGVERSVLPVEIYRNGPEHTYVALDSEDAVAAAAARHGAPARPRASPPTASREAAGAGRRACSTPAAGVPEDPATGSAAGPLALHLARHGAIEFGDEIEIRQGEEINRPSLSTQRSPAPPSSSSGSRSAAAPRSSRPASTGQLAAEAEQLPEPCDELGAVAQPGGGLRAV